MHRYFVLENMTYCILLFFPMKHDLYCVLIYFPKKPDSLLCTSILSMETAVLIVLLSILKILYVYCETCLILYTAVLSKELWDTWEQYKVILEASRQPELMLIVDKWEQLKYISTTDFIK